MSKNVDRSMGKRKSLGFGIKMKLDGKTAIVTGAGQGIGRGIALALAREGAKVVVNDISSKIMDVAKEVVNIGSEALAVRADVTNDEETKEMAKTVVERFGRIDILVNNAGIYPSKPLAEMTEEEWDRVITINLKGTFNCTKAVLPKMIEQGSGAIINISSIAGPIVGFINLTHYAASKAGVSGFTRAAALELAQHGIRVNAIAPGVIETPGTKAAGEEALRQMEQSIPLKRIGTPEDVAGLTVFLASEASSYITGQLITVDGGYTLQ